MTEQEVLAGRNQAQKLNLAAPEKYWTMPAAMLAKICNGYGPDAWPQPCRDVLTWIYRDMPVSSQIHDVRYDYSDGSADGRQAADAEMLENMIKEVKNAYPLWKVWRIGRRLADLGKAEAAYLMLRTYGSSAWMAAYQKRKTDK